MESDENADSWKLLSKRRAAEIPRSTSTDSIAEQAPVAVATATALAEPQKRGPGRPPGTVGSSLLRKRLRSMNNLEQEASSGPVQDRPSDIRRKTSDSHQDMFENQIVLGDQSLVGSTLQRQIHQFAKSQSQVDPCEVAAGQEPLNNPGLDILCSGTRPVTSATSLAMNSGEEIKTVSRQERRVAACVIEVAGHMWASCLHLITQLIKSEGWEGLLISKKRRYDETPLSVRLPATENSSVKAKILQTEYTLVILVHHPASGRYVHFEGRLPTWLQVLEACTANIIKHAQLEIENMVSNLHEVSEFFMLRSSIPCTDRHSSNIAAENQLRTEQPTWTLTHTFCTVHRCSTCTKSALNLLEGHVSGVLAIGLCCQMAGCTKQLRKHLSDIISERLEVKVGPPQCQEYRNQVYELRLQSIDTAKTGKKKSDKLPHLPKRQQLILNYFLNGDIESKDLVHWSPIPVKRSEVLAAFQKYVVGALIPHRCPRLQRGNFLGHERSFTWVALLALHHQLLEAVMTRFCRFAQEVPSQVGASAAGSKSVKPTFSAQESWQELMKQRSKQTQVSDAARVERPHLQELPEQTPTVLDQHDNFDPDIDWAEQNKANQRKAAAYAASNPGPILFLLLLALRPIERLMSDFIYLSSDDWDEHQQIAQAQSGKRSFRVCELLHGKQTLLFLDSISKLLLRPPCWLPYQSLNSACKTLMFRLLSREASAVQHYMVDIHKGFPFKLFDILDGNAAGVLATETCLRDDLATSFLQQFTEQELQERKALNMLSSLAHCISVDILQIEARHSAARRLSVAKSCQTWTLQFELLSAEWTNRQQVRLQASAADLALKATQQKNKAKVNRKRRGLGSKKKSGGGPYRAFLHSVWQKKNNAAAAQEFARLKQQGGPAWERLVELGHLATLARRRGILPLREARYQKARLRKQRQRCLKVGHVLSEFESQLRDAAKSWQQLSVIARRAETEQLALVEQQMLENAENEIVAAALPREQYKSQTLASLPTHTAPSFTVVRPNVAATCQDRLLMKHQDTFMSMSL